MLLLTSLAIKASVAHAEFEETDYFRCGDYAGANPDVAFTRVPATGESPISMKPAWIFSYAVKRRRDGAAPIREEISCLVQSVSSDSTPMTFSGKDCSATLSRDRDGKLSIAYGDKPVVPGCRLEVPLEELLTDFKSDPDKM